MYSTEHMDWYQRWQTVLSHITLVGTEGELQEMLQRLTQEKSPRVLAFVNAHAMNSMAGSEAFFQAINSADTILRDGSGMATLYKMLAISPGLNLNGTDLIPRIIQRYKGHKIALLGTQEPFLEQARTRIEQDLAPESMLVTEHGFHQPEKYVDFAIRHRPSLIVLGMGMPKQEQVAIQLRSALDFPCLIICGGAIIDFLGGKVTRAPALLRRTGMEWVYRLAMEPRRLFYRYVVGNPLFLISSLRYANGVKSKGAG